MKKNFTVLVDNGEKKPIDFRIEEPKSGRFCLSKIETVNLETGDYSIRGYEKIISIERKSGFAELFGNMTPKNNKERFEREMQRLSEFKYKYIVIGSSLDEDKWGMNPMQMKYGPGCGKIFQWLIEINNKYGVVPIFAGNCIERVVRKIFEEFLKCQQSLEKEQALLYSTQQKI